MDTPQQQGRNFERELSEEFGLELVPGSGSTWHSKLDLVGLGARWSLKYTESGAFPITVNDLTEAETACFGPGGDGKIPIWAARVPLGDYIIMRKEDFKALQKGTISLIEQDRPQVAARKARARQPELLREDS